MEHPDDAAPPPYWETEMYSASMSPLPLRPSSAHQNADDASVTASSSRSNIIYTPPETPNTQYGWPAAWGTDTSSLPASAPACLAARPAAGRPLGGHMVHTIHYAESIAPADVPCPGWATDRQISEKDWHDFVNNLLALHSEKANEYIADRKLRAEGGETPSEACQTMPGSQLAPTRPPANASRHEESYEAALKTVYDWNMGFFVPRGVTIELEPVPGSFVPRTWDPAAFDASRELPHQPSSRSPASSDSSSSSSGSDSSLDSLVDWDGMNNDQLPIVSQSIWNWARSVEPVPKAEYKRVKAEIKAARGARPASGAAQQKEIKKLLVQWREVKKSHKATKKAVRKAAKKDKKMPKRDLKAKIKERKGKTKNQEPPKRREARRDGPAAGSHTHGAFGSAPPDAPPPPNQPRNRVYASEGAATAVPGPSGIHFGGGGLWGRHSLASKQAALDRAQQARSDAAATVRAATGHADAVRDAANTREAVQKTAASALRHAHAARDAALDAARRQGGAAEGTARAHEARDGALRGAALASEQPVRPYQWGWVPPPLPLPSSWPSQALCGSPGDRERAGPGEGQPSTGSELQAQNAQQEREASAAQAGLEGAGMHNVEIKNRIRKLQDNLLAEEARGGRLW